MEYFFIAVSAFLASLVTFYSGFGLATLLMPVIAVFVPLPLAIGLTAIVHLVHSVLRAGLLWKAIHWDIVFRFGIPALMAVLPGALVLQQLSHFAPLKKYTVWGFHGEISLLHLFIGVLLILFASMERFPQKIGVKNLMLGGILSGFFGGLSGNQGAIRSAFLIQTRLSKEAFIGTNALIGAVVDLFRIAVYSWSFGQLLVHIDKPLLGTALGGALAGIFLGMTVLKKVTIAFIQRLILTLLYFLGTLLVLGLI
ncbi:MAG TPA: sulfite exporter TauE/SafE family protein [Rhabdochlamydiaceae bacterium]|nr:sulfite exporter TauE/SafE family protein [Rhabdochlamydiaceae bacterium]